MTKHICKKCKHEFEYSDFSINTYIGEYYTTEGGFIGSHFTAGLIKCPNCREVCKVKLDESQEM